MILAADAETLTARSVADGHQEWTVTLPTMQHPPAVLDNPTTFFVGVTAPRRSSHHRHLPGLVPATDP